MQETKDGEWFCVSSNFFTYFCNANAGIFVCFLQFEDISIAYRSGVCFSWQVA